MRTVNVDLYKYEELSPEAKKLVRDNLSNSEHYPFDNWYSCTKEDFHKILELIGFSNIDSYFTGFWSQGDGASFTGYYNYQKGMLKTVKQHAPMDKELHEIVRAIQDFMKRYGYKISCNIGLSGGLYFHSNTMSFIWEKGNSWDFDFKDNEDEKIIEQLFRDLADWYYNQLEKEYDFYLTDEALEQHILSQDLEYNSEGHEA